MCAASGLHGTETLDGSIMNMGSHCRTDSDMTCTLPAHTSYDHAFTMAASLPACSGMTPVAGTGHKSPKACYDEQLCMFCFQHVDEYYLIEEAMGSVKKTCANTGVNQMVCPSSADLQAWHGDGILHKIHNFWGARAINNHHLQ